MKLRGKHYDLKQKDGLFALYSVTKFAGGDHLTPLIANANIKQVKQKLKQHSKASDVEMAGALRGAL